MAKTGDLGFENGVRATRVDSLTIAAGGLQAKGRLSFKTGVLVLLSFQRWSAVSFGTKTKTQSPEFEKVFEVVPTFVPEADETRHGVTWRHSVRDGSENWMQLE